MRRPNRFSPAISLAILGLVIAPAAQGQAQAPWTITMRAMQNPLPAGQCTAIEVVVRDAGGRTPLRPDGRQLDWQDFELSFAAAPGSPPDAFRWSNEKHRFLCAGVAFPASGTVIAHYPGAHLRPGEFWSGVDVRQQVDIAIQGTPDVAVASTGMPSQPMAPGSAQAPGAAAAAVGQPYPSSPAAASQPYAPPPNQTSQGAAPAGAVTGYQAGGQAQPYPQPGYQAAGGAAAGGQAGVAAAGYPQPGAAGAAAAGYPPSVAPAGGAAAPAGAAYPQAGAAVGAPAAAAGGAYPQAGVAGGQAAASAPGYPQPGLPADPNAAPAYASPGYPQAPQATPAVPPSVVAITPAPAQGKPKSGGFFKKLGAHIKQRASDIKNQTAENLTNSANQVVDATTQTGTGLVAGATAQVSSAARGSVGGIGKAILPSKGQADNLAVALNYGQAEFRSRLFSGGPIPVLEPAGRELVQQFAAELTTRPGRFQIQVHVDPIDNALGLSKQQAGLFKNALVERGVDGSRLEAVGYGASALRPEMPPDGGPASSARLIIIPLNSQ